MDETILHVELTQGDVAALLNAADRIYSFIGYAQGAKARYQLRREQIVVALPVGKNNSPVRAGDLQIDSEAKTREEALYYSQEEIAKMPKLKDGHFRKTPDGYWQVRYRRGGYDIQFTSKKKAVVMDRFREWVRSVDDDEKAVLKKPLKRKTSFVEFAELYFTNVKAVNVKPVTYEMQERCLRNHILPALGAVDLRELTPMKCQMFLNGLLSAGFGRTAEQAKVLLKEILRAAVGERLIVGNPMDYVKLPKHQSVHGRALSKEEIAEFIERCKGSFYQTENAVRASNKPFAKFRSHLGCANIYRSVRRNSQNVEK